MRYCIYKPKRDYREDSVSYYAIKDNSSVVLKVANIYHKIAMGDGSFIGSLKSANFSATNSGMIRLFKKENR